VSFTEGGMLVGTPAKAQSASNPSNTIFDAKRLIGRS
jgi:molecular chaperone DnaK (HSP70)